MKEVSVNTLTELDLLSAQWLCVEAAVTTHLDRLGGSSFSRRLHHARKKRFEKAVELLKSGKSLLELGLLSEDCAWAAREAPRVVNGSGWQIRFKAAELEIQKAALLERSSVK